MSLVAARGPLGPNPAGWSSPPLPAGVVYVEPHPRRVQAVVAGEVVIDTERAVLVHRPDRALTYAFPTDAIGPLPHEPVAQAPGFVTVAWDIADMWLEEGRVLVHYPPNPYHRVDCRPTRRRLRVLVGDVVLVDTDETVIVFETSLPPRLYVAPSLVRTDLLTPSEMVSYCNYKGAATYWSANVGGSVVTDVAWSHREPLPESSIIVDHLCFDETRVSVDAELPPGSRDR